jgi:hypothetical protein
MAKFFTAERKLIIILIILRKVKRFSLKKSIIAYIFEQVFAKVLAVINVSVNEIFSIQKLCFLIFGAGI